MREHLDEAHAAADKLVAEGHRRAEEAARRRPPTSRRAAGRARAASAARRCPTWRRCSRCWRRRASPCPPSCRARCSPRCGSCCSRCARCSTGTSSGSRPRRPSPRKSRTSRSTDAAHRLASVADARSSAGFPPSCSRRAPPPPPWPRRWSCRGTTSCTPSSTVWAGVGVRQRPPVRRCQVFSFVEAAVLLVAAGVLFLVLVAGSQRKAFHLPGGTGR